MSNFHDSELEMLLQQKLKELAAEVPKPDIDEAWSKLVRRTRRKSDTKKYAVAVVVCLFILILTTLPGPIQAFRGFLRFSISRMIDDTALLKQTGYTRDDKIQVRDNELTEVFYNNLGNLQKEKTTGLFIPGEQYDDIFISARILKSDDQILQISLEFYFEQSNSVFLEQLVFYGEGSTGESIDIEDFEIEEIHINGTEVTAYIHKTGLTSLHWHNNNIECRLSGSVPLETLLDYVNILQLFN